jgi:hypothetical protein
MTDHARTESVAVGGITLEPAYAGFSRGKITDNEGGNPGYGYTVAYQGSMGEATVYVYSKNEREIPDGPTSQVVMEEFNQATREVLLLGQMTGAKIELVDRYGTGSPERGEEFLCAEFVLSDELGPRRTFLCVTGAANRFVKIRTTLRSNDASDPAARNFVDAVASRLWSKNTDEPRSKRAGVDGAGEASSDLAAILVDEFAGWFRNLAANGVIPRVFSGVTKDGKQAIVILNDLPLDHVQRRDFLTWLCRTEQFVAYAYGTWG